MYLLRDNSIAFLINYKSCYSTFEYLKKNNVIYTNNNINDIIFKDIPIYLIVRDPIKRFISFYKDKIINKIFNEGTFNQDCHQELLKYYTKEYIMNKKFTIDNMIDALEKGYNDPHLNKQIINYYKVKKINKNIQIIKMEDEYFENKVCKLLNIDNLPKCNETSYIQNIELSNEQIDRLKKFYEEDYKNFNY